MIAARKNTFFNFILRRFLSWTLRRRFHNVYVVGGEHLRELPPDCPVVGCVNHSNWWDGFVLYVLSYRLLPHEIYLAMEEENLRHYAFFRWMGVFGLDLSSPRRSVGGLRYAVSLLRRREDGSRPTLIWMFVQGRLLAGSTPIEVKEGALWLAERTGAQILPLVLRYEWLSESRPSIFVHIGRPMTPDSTGDDLAACLNWLYAGVPGPAAAPGGSTYQPLYPPQMSINKRWDHFKHVLLRSPEPFEGQNR
jgi:1-acyl-sn-glycerol-3-phosphate acyltransferase